MTLAQLALLDQQNAPRDWSGHMSELRKDLIFIESAPDPDVTRGMRPEAAHEPVEADLLPTRPYDQHSKDVSCAAPDVRVGVGGGGPGLEPTRYP